MTIKYDVEDIGIDSPRHFSGRRADLTAWDAVFVGCGDDAGEALKDACENAALNGYKTTDVVWSFISTEKAHDRCTEGWNREHPDYGEETEQERDFEREHERCDRRYYVALYVSDARTTLTALNRSLENVRSPGAGIAPGSDRLILSEALSMHRRMNFEELA